MTWRSRLTALTASLLLLVGCGRNDDGDASAGSPPADTMATDAADGLTDPLTADDSGSTERLRAAIPRGWERTYQLNRDSTRISDFVPTGQSATDWQERLAFEAFRDTRDLDPIQMLLDEVERDRQRCDNIQHFNLFSGLENNYPTSVRLFQCSNNAFVGKGEIKIMKAIQGNDYFYLVRFEARTAPFDPGDAITGDPGTIPDGFSRDTVARWSDYLRRVNACDPAVPAHPCKE